ncbi:MAG TPA: hypothetical protein VME17_09965 [Bryobacteraceae bacterium]|nr:hypothetical protein [Bryobacteraceae bacterium]
MPSKVGAEPKKVAALVAILVIGVVVYLYNSSNSGDETESSTPAAAAHTPAAIPYGAGAARRERSSFRVAAGADSGSHEFRPSLKNKIIDPSTIDPTLHLGLLAKLKSVNPDAGTRSLFEIAAAPPAEINVKEPAKILIARHFVGPQPPRPPPPVVEPKAPPIPLKFYGFVDKTKAGDKRAFFLDGDDIVIASEGDTVKKRYKIIRIGVNSAVVEDTQFKSNNQQTLPLIAELAG